VQQSKTTSELQQKFRAQRLHWQQTIEVLEMEKLDLVNKQHITPNTSWRFFFSLSLNVSKFAVFSTKQNLL
jgi:hypothetical protein